MKTALGFLILAGTASTALAGVPLPVPGDQPMIPAANVTFAPLDSVSPAVGPVKYSSIPGPYYAYAAASFAKNDDYVSTSVGTMAVDTFKFVGGSVLAGGILDIFFLDVTNTTVVDSFGVSLPSGGNFIWSIGLGGAFNADAVGHVQIQTRGTTTGTWFMTVTAPSVGANNGLAGHGGVDGLPGGLGYGTFEFQVPAPGAMALLGLGGLMAARRRR